MASPISPRASSGNMIAARDLPAASRKVGSSILVWPAVVQRTDPMDFNQHAVDVDLSEASAKRVPGAHWGHRENSDRDRSCGADIVGKGLHEMPTLKSAYVHQAERVWERRRAKLGS